jgi:hypothetical protein
VRYEYFNWGILLHTRNKKAALNKQLFVFNIFDANYRVFPIGYSSIGKSRCLAQRQLHLACC